jgi:hypothetical protein
MIESVFDEKMGLLSQENAAPSSFPVCFAANSMCFLSFDGGKRIRT